MGLGISTWMFFQERAAKQEQARLRLQAEAQEQKAQTEAAKSQQVARLQAGIVAEYLERCERAGLRGRSERSRLPHYLRGSR